MDYQVTLYGTLDKGEFEVMMKVVVPVTSLCPCSKSISKYGAHNQRSHITIKAKATKGETLHIEDLIDLAERKASCELYAILKRDDEKLVTERAYDNPAFVEDLVRDIALDLNNDEKISYYRLESENFESIHNHSAYALIENQK
jgi:GTP cyclohydrolase I (EC 3.5.4.16)